MGVQAGCRWLGMVSYPVLDHAQLESTHERLIASFQWCVKELVQCVRIEQPTGVEVAIEEKASNRLLVIAVYGKGVIHKGALASTLEYVLRKLFGEGIARDGAVAASGDPHPAGNAEASFHHWLREQRHAHASAIGAEHDIRKQLIACEIANSLAITGQGIGWRCDPRVQLQWLHWMTSCEQGVDRFACGPGGHA